MAELSKEAFMTKLDSLIQPSLAEGGGLAASNPFTVNITADEDEQPLTEENAVDPLIAGLINQTLETVEAQFKEQEKQVSVDDGLKGVSVGDTESKESNTREYKFPHSVEEIRKAVAGLIKPDSVSFTTVMGEGYKVTFKIPVDKDLAELNEYLTYQLDKGVRRTNVEVFESYTDPITKMYTPSRRIESSYYVNIDESRLNIRADMACHLLRLNGVDLSKKSISDKIKVLDEISPRVLNAIYRKAYQPFAELLEVAQERFENF